MKIRQWIFPAFLALLFAAVLLAGLVPWDRILPEKEEEPAPAEIEFTGTSVTDYHYFRMEDGHYTVQPNYTNGEPDGVIVTYHTPDGDFPVYYPSEDDIPESVTITYQNTGGALLKWYRGTMKA